MKSFPIDCDDFCSPGTLYLLRPPPPLPFPPLLPFPPPGGCCAPIGGGGCPIDPLGRGGRTCWCPSVTAPGIGGGDPASCLRLLNLRLLSLFLAWYGMVCSWASLGGLGAMLLSVKADHIEPVHPKDLCTSNRNSRPHFE